MKSIAEQANTAAYWWRGLQPNTAAGDRNPAADRAALARLRRADLLSAMGDPATFDLFRKLGRRRPEDLPKVALCAAVLAGVREDRLGEHPARTLGPPSPEAVEQAAMKPLRFRRLIEAEAPEAVEQAAMKPLRFRRLIEAEAPEDRLILLRRAVQLADRRLNLRELAAACLDWSRDRRQRWIYEYYAAGRAAPDAADAPAEEPAL